MDLLRWIETTQSVTTGPGRPTVGRRAAWTPQSQQAASRCRGPVRGPLVCPKVKARVCAFAFEGRYLFMSLQTVYLRQTRFFYHLIFRKVLTN